MVCHCSVPLVRNRIWSLIHLIDFSLFPFKGFKTVYTCRSIRIMACIQPSGIIPFTTQLSMIKFIWIFGTGCEKKSKQTWHREHFPQHPGLSKYLILIERNASLDSRPEEFLKEDESNHFMSKRRKFGQSIRRLLKLVSKAFLNPSELNNLNPLTPSRAISQSTSLGMLIITITNMLKEETI